MFHVNPQKVIAQLAGQFADRRAGQADAGADTNATTADLLF